jgi:hypothetical protein
MGGRPTAVVVSGHMIDAPDRPSERFPPREAGRVGSEVEAALDGWAVGPGTTLVTGGARGADIIAAELARARGAALHLVLAFEPDRFVEQSVALPGTDWEQRFRALLPGAELEVVGGDEDDVYARTNARILAAARALDPHPHAVIVWNGAAGDGPGGTADFVAQLGARPGDDRVQIIDPTPRE